MVWVQGLVIWVLLEGRVAFVIGEGVDAVGAELGISIEALRHKLVLKVVHELLRGRTLLETLRNHWGTVLQVGIRQETWGNSTASPTVSDLLLSYVFEIVGGVDGFDDLWGDHGRLVESLVGLVEGTEEHVLGKFHPREGNAQLLTHHVVQVPLLGEVPPDKPLYR